MILTQCVAAEQDSSRWIKFYISTNFTEVNALNLFFNFLTQRSFSHRSVYYFFSHYSCFISFKLSRDPFPESTPWPPPPARSYWTFNCWCSVELRWSGQTQLLTVFKLHSGLSMSGTIRVLILHTSPEALLIRTPNNTGLDKRHTDALRRDIDCCGGKAAANGAEVLITAISINQPWLMYMSLFAVEKTFRNIYQGCNKILLAGFDGRLLNIEMSIGLRRSRYNVNVTIRNIWWCDSWPGGDSRGDARKYF